MKDYFQFSYVHFFYNFGHLSHTVFYVYQTPLYNFTFFKDWSISQWINLPGPKLDMHARHFLRDNNYTANYCPLALSASVRSPYNIIRLDSGPLLKSITMHYVFVSLIWLVSYMISILKNSFRDFTLRIFIHAVMFRLLSCWFSHVPMNISLRFILSIFIFIMFYCFVI